MQEVRPLYVNDYMYSLTQSLNVNVSYYPPGEAKRPNNPVSIKNYKTMYNISSIILGVL